MSTTQDILDAAEKLGELIADHDATKKMEDVAKRLDDDVEAQRLIADLNRQQASLEEKAQKGQPIEVDDKRKMQTLQDRAASHPLLRELQMLQMDYVDLMRKVDERISGDAGGR